MNSNLKKSAEALQEAESKVLKYLSKEKSAYSSKISKAAKLSEVQINRAALWLENKGLAKVEKKAENFAELGALGKKYLKNKLPERRFLESIRDKPLTLDEIKKKANLDKQEFSFCLGYLKKKGWVLPGKHIIITEYGKKQLKKPTFEEHLLEKLGKSRLNVSDLKPEENYALDALKKRQDIIDLVKETSQKIIITEKGSKVVKIPVKVKVRRYDISSPVPKIYPGKKQAYRAFQDEVKKELTSMGFQEMTGPVIESCFYNCDALYMPQDHPARGIHDLYSISGKSDAKDFTKYVKKVGDAHEKGWGYKFDENKSKELILRSQGTALSARTLAKAEVPGKYFALAKCYRPDVVDVTHLTEFYQLEGIVLDKNVNFRHLLGLLGDFAKRIAHADKIKFVPVAYFPFTEPSVTGYIWHKELKQWIEVLPAGIFRPEVTEPFGIKVPVLAWGIGLDRLFMIREGINDIRQLFSYNLNWLREAKI